jgi:hypothetical protein
MNKMDALTFISSNCKSSSQLKVTTEYPLP